MQLINKRAVLIAGVIGAALLHRGGVGITPVNPTPNEAPPPVIDTELFKDLHIAELKSALTGITVQMASVRAKKHWQRAELDVLKHHRRLLSGCLAVLENTPSVTMEQLLQADELLDAYKHATS